MCELRRAFGPPMAPRQPSVMSNRSSSVGECMEPMLMLDIDPTPPAPMPPLTRLLDEDRFKKQLVALLRFDWLSRLLPPPPPPPSPLLLPADSNWNGLLCFDELVDNDDDVF